MVAELFYAVQEDYHDADHKRTNEAQCHENPCGNHISWKNECYTNATRQSQNKKKFKKRYGGILLAHHLYILTDINKMC